MRLEGSLNNRLMEVSVQEPATVGGAATVTLYSDRHAATIIEATPKRIAVQEDQATRTDSNGISDAQSYSYTPNPQGRITVFTLRRNGRWVMQGDSMRSASCGLVIGVRDSHHDYSF